MNINELLNQAIEKGASDLHLSTGVPPLLRIDGDLKGLNYPNLEGNETLALIHEMMTEPQKEMFAKQQELDFSFTLANQRRFRTNAFIQNRGPAAVIRCIPAKALTLEELSAPPIIKEICKLKQGLVLVTGPSGSGKSTTLAGMVDYINRHREDHIITIEDPIEYVHTSQRSLINQREVFRDTLGFSQALHSALREDPDVILVGELRDLETIRLALTAAETGHLVLATVHTASASKTIDRLIDVFPGEEKSMVRSMLSESLMAVISQRLIKRIDQGRMAMFEIMICTPAIRNLIREGKLGQMISLMQTGRNMGMQTFDQHRQVLLANKLISIEEPA